MIQSQLDVQPVNVLINIKKNGRIVAAPKNTKNVGGSQLCNNEQTPPNILKATSEASSH